ncbi:hypothetical protein ACFLR5_01420 [Elusimicrobiota bacterium]
MRFIDKKIYFLLFLVFISGCVKVYNNCLQPIKSDVRKGRFDSAISRIEKTQLSKSWKDRLLYNIEAGLLYHLAGRHRKSNLFFEEAEWISDEMYTKSLSAAAASMVTSDNIIPYYGQEYEYLLINYYKLLNYLLLGEYEDALVECRRLNHKLPLFDTELPVLHYITAILYELDKQTSSAFIEYKKAYRSYQEYDIPVPESLLNDIAYFCKKTDFPRKAEFPASVINRKTSNRSAELIAIIESGFVPYINEERIETAIPQEYHKKYPEELVDTYYVNVALPVLHESLNKTDTAILKLNNNSVDLHTAENISKVFKKEFEKKKGQVAAKSIARAVTKYLTYKSVKGKSGKDDENILRKLLGFTVNVFNVATEKADTRAWLLLPACIYFNRIPVDPGIIDTELILTGVDGKTTGIYKDEIEIKPDEVRFLVLRGFIDQ